MENHPFLTTGILSEGERETWDPPWGCRKPLQSRKSLTHHPPPGLRAPGPLRRPPPALLPPLPPAPLASFLISIP